MWSSFYPPFHGLAAPRSTVKAASRLAREMQNYLAALDSETNFPNDIFFQSFHLELFAFCAII